MTIKRYKIKDINQYFHVILNVYYTTRGDLNISVSNLDYLFRYVRQ